MILDFGSEKFNHKTTLKAKLETKSDFDISNMVGHHSQLRLLDS